MTTIRALADKVDERLGDGLERLLCAHHVRRLRRLGWARVLQRNRPAGWFAEGAAVRAGNRIEVLIDGEQALPAMRAAIEGASSSVHVANWYASPDFRPTREPDAPTLRKLLSTAARRVPVRLLLWAGPPVPVFAPTRAMVNIAQRGFTRDSAVRCVLDARERTLHCHHEKLVIVDETTAFLGGIDFTALQGDRHDSRRHPADRPIGWHDLMARIEGPIVADVANHFQQRWNAVTGEQLPPPSRPAPIGSSTAQLVRTIPEKTYPFAPRGEFTILDGYLRALRCAQRLIYVENQFLWAPEITEILIDKLRRPPADTFRMVVLLPRKPSNGADTTRGQLGRLIDADDGHRRLLAVTLTAHDHERSAPVYVHAKLGIVDDEWMTIGSANLNEHSLFNDTEVNLITDDTDLIRTTRLRLWAEHLQRRPADIDGDPAEVIDQIWRPTAEGEADRQSRGLPRIHHLTLLPGVSRRTSRLQGPLRGLLVDG